MKGKLYAASVALGDTGKLPEWYLVFADGQGEVEGKGKFVVDAKAWTMISAAIDRRGIEIVFDYEHQSLLDMQAPAAGWCKQWRYRQGLGIEAKVEWTAEAAAYIAELKYRYYSPVFYVRESDHRVTGIHSIALTNTPATNDIKPLLAKLGARLQRQEDDKMLKKLIARLALSETATEDEVMAEVDKLSGRTPPAVIAALDINGEATVETVVAKIKERAAQPAMPPAIAEALELDGAADVSTVVASIHALRQGTKSMVSKADFIALQKKISERDAAEAVAAALAEGKITAAQQEWAAKYAESDLAGFKVFTAKAPVVVPMDKLPDGQRKSDEQTLDAVVMTVAKMMDIDSEDIKKYGGVQ